MFTVEIESVNSLKVRGLAASVRMRRDFQSGAMMTADAYDKNIGKKGAEEKFPPFALSTIRVVLAGPPSSKLVLDLRNFSLCLRMDVPLRNKTLPLHQIAMFRHLICVSCLLQLRI